MSEAFALLAATALLAPFAFLGLQGLAALGFRPRKGTESNASIGVIVPAHDEGDEIEDTLCALRGELRERDRVVVVSDNSTDRTAEIASACGAEVVRRVDPLRRGKGYALEAGVRHLASSPPNVVVVLDADCRPEPGALRRVAARAALEDRPVQGPSLVRPGDDGFLSKISSLAFHLRNEIRPRGLERLGLPVVLQGTGMAIPWAQLERVALGSSHLAEDRKLGVSLSINGATPRCEPEARFWSSLEADASVSGDQRSRWERGHLAASVEDVPRLIAEAVRQRRWELGALAAELAIPPLGLLLLGWAAAAALALVIGVGPIAVLAILLPGMTAFCGLALAALRSSSTPVSPGFLLASPVYAIAKAPLYARAVLGKKLGWVRARRETPPADCAEEIGHGSGEEELREVEMAGVRIHPITESECVRRVLDSCEAGRGGWVVTPNVDFLERSQRDPSFRGLLRSASLSVPDGMPLVWAARIAGEPVEERVAGSDLIWSLCAGAAAQGRSVFLLGGNEGTAEAAAAVLTERHPEIRIAGWLCPPYGFEDDERELDRIRTAIKAAKPDLVFVGLGSPKSERFIASVHLTHRRFLPSTWWAGVGVSFSFVCGEIDRAPVAFQRLGLEWLHRLYKEPRRLASRYLLRDLPFTFGLLARALLLRWSKPGRVSVKHG